MYNSPIPFSSVSAKDAAEIAAPHWNTAKNILAAIAIIVLGALLLVGLHAIWVQVSEWCQAALSPVNCGIYLTGR